MAVMKTPYFTLCLTTAAVALLTACGGGESGGSAPAAVSFSAGCSDGSARVSALSRADAQAQCPVAAGSSIRTTAPAASYPAGSEELAAFELLNAERRGCGFGVLVQNVRLDAAAQAHADWRLFNNYSGHFEVSGTPGFTGVTPADRIVAATYAADGAFAAAEVLSDVAGPGAGNKAGRGAAGVRTLLNAPYHAAAMIDGYRDVGLAVRSATDAGASAAYGERTALGINLAYRATEGAQLVEADAVLTYPCEGSTGLSPALSNETPNPVPGRDLAASPLGSSVQVMLRPGRVLTLASASMVNVATGAVVALRPPVTSATDPYAEFLPHQGYVVADAPLAAHTSYQVNLTGTNNQKPFSRSFIFTTGL